MRYPIKATILILMLTLTGCVEEVEVVKEIEITKSWSTQIAFDNLTKIKTNTLATDAHLFVYGPKFFSSIDEENQVSHAFTRLNYPTFFRLPISKNYFIEAEGKWLRFASSKYPVRDENSAWIDLQALDPSFQGINFGSKYQIGAIDINTLGQCMVPIYTVSPGNNVTAYLFETTIKDDMKIEVSDTIKVSIPNSSAIPSEYVYCSKAIKDYFIISLDNSTFKIYSNGEHKKIIDTSIFNVFLHGNTLYALKQFNQLYISKNDGETWEFYENYPDYLVLANYFVLGDSLIATRNSDIFSVKFNGNQYKIRPLLNDGLETNEITSVSEFKDSIYVSTYSGLYFKGKSKFYEGKKAE
ncbi:MAG: hypothetical protein JNK18_14265 [Cyclobacteriaceae bacterium]|nr:hypothetical protein [Cyclobacteriaceae bacterium]